MINVQIVLVKVLLGLLNPSGFLFVFNVRAFIEVLAFKSLELSQLDWTNGRYKRYKNWEKVVMENPILFGKVN